MDFGEAEFSTLRRSQIGPQMQDVSAPGSNQGHISVVGSSVHGELRVQGTESSFPGNSNG